MSVKLRLDIDNETWDEVKKYKIDRKFKTLNDTVVEMIKEQLQCTN